MSLAARGPAVTVLLEGDAFAAVLGCTGARLGELLVAKGGGGAGSATTVLDSAGNGAGLGAIDADAAGERLGGFANIDLAPAAIATAATPIAAIGQSRGFERGDFALGAGDT